MAILLCRTSQACLRSNAGRPAAQYLRLTWSQTVSKDGSSSWNHARQQYNSTIRSLRTATPSSSSAGQHHTPLSLCGLSSPSRASIGSPRAIHCTKAALQTSQTPPPKSEKESVERSTQQVAQHNDHRQVSTEPTKGITDRLANARERTKEVTSRVKSSLTNLTPHENIYNLPNLLTVSRLFAAPLTAYLLVHDQHTWALAVFAYAGFTDLVDGWMARKWKLQTVAGSVIDPMADKALMIIVTVTLAVKAAIPAYLATLILGRDASLAIAAIWYRYASLPAPKTLARYWDFSLPSAEVHPTTVSKYNTFLQLILIGSTLALPVVTADNHHLGMLHDLGLGKLDLHQAMLYLQMLVAGTTVWSGLSYAFLKNAVTIIGSNEALKARQGAIGRGIIGASFGAIVLVAAYLALDELQEKKQDSKQVKVVS